jgi:hypothetical protein
LTGDPDPGTGNDTRLQWQIGQHLTEGLPLFRANIMLRVGGKGRYVWHDSQAAYLQMRFYTAGYNDSERKFHWGRGEGCAGHAWETVAMVLGSDSAMPHVPANVTLIRLAHPHGIDETIRTVLAVPLQHKGHLIGVLSFDDDTDVPGSLLCLDTTIAAITTRAGSRPNNSLLHRRVDYGGQSVSTLPARACDLRGSGSSASQQGHCWFGLKQQQELSSNRRRDCSFRTKGSTGLEMACSRSYERRSRLGPRRRSRKSPNPRPWCLLARS